MVVIASPSSYAPVRVEVDRGPRHKYVLVLRHRTTGRLRRVPFGGKYPNGTPYPQYRDRIGFYRSYDHGDRKRRLNYLSRHRGEAARLYSSGWASIHYLW